MSLSVTIDPERQGRCYPLAFEHAVEADDRQLVHGSLSGGRCHAWVEWPSTTPPTVYDPVTDDEYPRDTYYALAGATPERRYTPEQAADAFERLQHYGPWH